MRKQLICAVAACLLLATGCATSGEFDKLENRVSDLEQRFGDVERRAAAAEATAQRAAMDAQSAAQSADRADAMFKKTVTK
jgi:outer membrane murein-binding lipoprotein Lpp